MATADCRPEVLITGSVSAVFSDLYDWLQQSAGSSIQHAADLSQALRLLHEQPHLPDVLIVFQGHPGEYSAEDAARLIGALPGRRVFCISSGWCVSAARTHDIWPLACQIPIGSARARLLQELQAWRQGHPAATPLLGAEELFSLLATPSASDTAVHSAAAVVSADRALATAISGLLAPSTAVVCHPDVASLQSDVSSGTCQLILIDEDDLSDEDAELLLETRAPGVQVVSFSGYPDCPRPAWADFRMDKSELTVQLRELSPLVDQKRAPQ